MVAWKTIIMMIAILATFIILLFAVVLPMAKSAVSAGAGVCGLKLYMMSVAKSATLGLVMPNTPPECKTQIVKVTEGMVEDYLDYADVAFDKYDSDPKKYAEVLQYFNTQGPGREASKWEWALDKVIADQLFNCWSLKAAFGSINTVALLESASINCLECSIIQFKDSKILKEKIGINSDKHKRPFIADKNYIGSLGAFMRAEVKGQSQDKFYAEKTYDEWINNAYQFQPLKEVPFNLDEQLSVNYVMTTETFTISFDEGFDTNVQKTWLELIPSAYLTRDIIFFGREHKKCEKIIGS